MTTLDWPFLKTIPRTKDYDSILYTAKVMTKKGLPCGEPRHLMY